MGGDPLACRRGILLADCGGLSRGCWVASVAGRDGNGSGLVGGGWCGSREAVVKVIGSPKKRATAPAI